MLMGIFLGGIILLMLMIIKFKVNPFLALFFTSLVIGLCAGLPVAKILSSISAGFGGTLGDVYFHIRPCPAAGGSKPSSSCPGRSCGVDGVPQKFSMRQYMPTAESTLDGRGPNRHMYPPHIGSKIPAGGIIGRVHGYIPLQGFIRDNDNGMGVYS